MSCEEEQALELEALESIFVNEGELIVKSSTNFFLKLTPHPENEEGIENHVCATLEFTFPPNYPESENLEWDLINEDNTGLPVEKLQVLKSEIIPNSLEELGVGAVQVYGLAEAVQDWLRENILVTFMLN